MNIKTAMDRDTDMFMLICVCATDMDMDIHRSPCPCPYLLLLVKKGEHSVHHYQFITIPKHTYYVYNFPHNQ